MGIGIAHARHVKLPVTDLARSGRWYQRLLDLELWMEFVENDEVRGVQLREPDTGFGIALRLRQYCASQPDLAGFDPVAFNVASRGVLLELITRAEALQAQHSGLRDQGALGAGVDVIDPDGTVIRFIWVGPGAPDGFIGTVFDSAGMHFYTTPRLSL